MSAINLLLNRYGLWMAYAAFVCIAVFTHSGEPIFFSEGPYAAGKPILWLILLAFLVYSWRIGQREDFFKSVQRMWSNLWFRQISLDLYIGLLIPLFLIYLHSGSIVVLLLWFLPVLFFANLATLVFLALNYDALIAGFV